MAGAGKKTFTAGEILTASDTNTYLMEQTVMNFAGTAARASAIPTPSTGMTTYIGTTGTASIPQIETYTGSAWQTPYGQTLVANVNFTSAADINIDNVFSSAYQNYVIKLSINTSAAVTLAMRLRDGSGDSTGTNYQFSAMQIVTNVWASLDNSTGQNFWNIGYNSGSVPVSSTVNISNPNVAARTSYDYSGSYNQLGLFGGGMQSATTQWTGFKVLVGSGTITGNVRVYGLRNS